MSRLSFVLSIAASFLFLNPAHADNKIEVKELNIKQPHSSSYKTGDTFKDCNECPEMVVIPSGSFMMGSPSSELGRLSLAEWPRHKVTIPVKFAVAQFAVTRAQFTTFVNETGYEVGNECTIREKGKPKNRPGRSYLNPNYPQDGRHPVVCVNWKDTNAYLRWLSRKTKKTYRLLSEAEWEYVARAKTDTPFWWGKSISTNQANYNGNFSYNGSKGKFLKKTVPVDSFEPNGFGLFNVHGNVFEWVEDCWHENYLGAPKGATAWIKGSDCSNRVIRGGSWENPPHYIRSSMRAMALPNDRDYTIGFRVARTLISSPKVLETKTNGYSEKKYNDLSVEKLNSYSKKAYDETVVEFQASSPRPTNRFTWFSLIADSTTPIMSIVSEKIRGEWGIGISLSCGRARAIDIVALLPFTAFGTKVAEKVKIAEKIKSGGNLRLRISSIGQGELQIPVKLIKFIAEENSVQVVGSASIDNPFFKTMGLGRYLSMNLFQDGKHTGYKRRTDGLEGFDHVVKPLLDQCRGESQKDSIAQVTGGEKAKHSVSNWIPNAREIRDALQRRVNQHITALENAGNSCDSLGRSSNNNNISPFTALGCLVAETAKRANLKVQIGGVNLKKCVRSKKGIAYCLYDVKADTQLPSSAKLFETIFDSAFLLPHPVWGSYARVNGRWEHRQTFKNCSLSESKIDCSFQ